MIISRTPFRISIFGGGTDYPILYRENGCAANIEIKPISIKPKKLKLLQKHLMLVFSGFSRTASENAAEQIKNTPREKPELQAEVRKALGDLLVIPLKFETSGSQIIFSKPGTYYGN